MKDERRNNCFELSTLSNYVKQNLEQDQSNLIKNHLQGCEECEDLVENISCFYSTEEVDDFDSSSGRLSIISLKYIFKNKLAKLNANGMSFFSGFQMSSLPAFRYGLAFTALCIFAFSMLMYPTFEFDNGLAQHNEQAPSKSLHNFDENTKNGSIYNLSNKKQNKINEEFAIVGERLGNGFVNSPLDDFDFYNMYENANSLISAFDINGNLFPDFVASTSS